MRIDDAGGASRLPPPPPPANPAAQATAASRISRNLDDSGAFNTVSRDEARDSAAALTGLNGTDAGAVIDHMQADGSLDKFARESVESQNSWFGPDGFSRDEQDTFFAAMAQKLDGAHLATLARAYKEAGAEHEQRLADAVSRYATPQAAHDFVATLAPGATDGGKGGMLGGSYVDADAQAIGTVLSSLRGEYAASAFASLTPDQMSAVFRSSTGLETTTVSSGYTATTLADVKPEGFTRLMDAARTITDPAYRASVLTAASSTVSGIAGTYGVQDWHVAPLAAAVIAAADARTLESMGPQAAATLAGQAAHGDPAALTQTLSSATRLESSAGRDALIRTLFLKTDGNAYKDDPALAGAMGAALASTIPADSARTGTTGADLARLLGTDEGRALLADPSIDANARLWAMDQVATDPARIDRLVGGTDRPWENSGLVELHAAARIDRFAAARGDAGVRLSGGSDFANFVGAGLGAPTRSDLPADPAALQRAQTGAATGGYDFYANVEAVQKPAGGIRNAQADMGGGDVQVGVIPIQFSSQASGPIDLQLYRVDGANGQSRYVDNIGRVYSDFAAWKNENELPPGQMTYPADGTLDAAAGTRLETANTPNVSDTFWEHAGDVADVAALVGGVVASGVIIFASGGTATPLVAGAWAVAVGSAAYAGGRAVADLTDRAKHDQSLSLTDPEARAAWVSLAGSGLTVAGAGATRLAGLAADETALAVNGARAAGLLNAGANYADAAATLDSASSLVTNWDRMTPAERAQTGLQIAFWGGMTGLSAKTGGGSVTDAFSFRAQMNHAMLETGAATRVNPELRFGEASIVPVRNGRGGITDIRVDYGPGTSRAVIDVHTQVARNIVSNAGSAGAVRRAFGSDASFPPGSRGEEVGLEVAKHEMLLDAIATRLGQPDLTAPERAALVREQGDTRFELSAHQGELDAIRANPALGTAAGLGSVDVKRSAEHWLDPANTVPRDATAQTSFAALRTSVASDFPAATRVALDASGGLRLADGTEIRNFGPGTNQLQRFTQPQSQGGYGGALFYDRASGTVIAAVNMRSEGSPNVATRVEVPFARNAAGEWRADFSRLAPYKTSIDPALPPERAVHFRAANMQLRDAMAADPSIAAPLDLGAKGEATVAAARGLSPEPYTWHHVDGGGRIWLVDSAIHGMFLHTGGYSEWAPAPSAGPR